MPDSFDLHIDYVTSHNISIRFQHLNCIGLGREGMFALRYIPDFDPITEAKQLRINHHDFEITGLIPNTKYFFSITKTSGTTVSEEATFERTTLSPTSK